MVQVKGQNNESFIQRFIHGKQKPGVNTGSAAGNKGPEENTPLNIKSTHVVSENSKKGIAGNLFHFDDVSRQIPVKIPNNVKIAAATVSGGIIGGGLGAYIGKQIGLSRLANVTPGFTTEDVAALLAFQSKEKAVIGVVIGVGIAGIAAYSYFNDKK